MRELMIEIGPNLFYTAVVAALVVVILGWFRFKAGGRKIL